MERVYAYVRVSTKKQNLQRQITNIKEYCKSSGTFLDRTYEEKYTGTKVEGRTMFQKLLVQVEKDVSSGAGVTIIFDSVSRMSRNAAEGVKQYFEWYDRGVNLIFLNERAISTVNYRNSLISIGMTGTDADLILEGVNKFLRKLAENQIVASFQQSEKEAKDIKKRVVEGLANTEKKSGRRRGTRIVTKKETETKALIRKYSKEFGGSVPDKDIIKMADVSRGSYYKYKNQMISEEESKNA